MLWAKIPISTNGEMSWYSLALVSRNVVVRGCPAAINRKLVETKARGRAIRSKAVRT